MTHKLFYWMLCFGIVQCGLLGCSKSAPPMSDPAAAIRLVDAALKQWSEGSDWSELTRLAPPVYMSEDSWREGWKLRQFTIDESAVMVGTNVRVSVNLRCLDNNGKQRNMSIRYFVTTRPAQTIAREER